MRPPGPDVSTKVRAGGPGAVGAPGVVSREPVAIACTLAPDALPSRVQEWRTVLERVTTRSLIPNGVRLTFGGDAPVAEIAQLALAEHACCGFFTFTVVVNAQDITLDVTAPPDAAPLVTGLFGSPD